MGRMFYGFCLSLLVFWLAAQADYPVAAFLGYAFSAWLLLSYLIVTYSDTNGEE